MGRGRPRGSKNKKHIPSGEQLLLRPRQTKPSDLVPTSNAPKEPPDEVHSKDEREGSGKMYKRRCAKL
jgi:hypothetical protein